MNVLLFIDAAVLVFVSIGFHLAFRQKTIRRWLKPVQVRVPAASRSAREGAAADRDEDEFAPVLRMLGIMIMAFSFTVGAFASLITYYTAHSPN
jgi:hypothetical protein